MTTTTALTTELNAVNMCLSAIGEDAVSTLTDTSDADVADARRKINEVIWETLTEGYHFNTDEDYPLTPDVDGKIDVTAISVDVPYGQGVDVVLRGTRLYDRKARSYTFTVSELKANITWLLEWTDLPQPVRWYIACRAAMDFQADALGSEAVDQRLARRAAKARQTFVEWDAEQADNTIFDAPTQAAIVDRRVATRYYY